MPSTWFPNSITYHVAETGLSRLSFPGTIAAGTPPTYNPPPPITSVTPPTMHLAPQDFGTTLVDPTLEPPVEAFIPQSVEPPVAHKRRPMRKHRRQTVPV